MNTDNEKKTKLGLKDIIYRNTFILFISFIAAVVIWFSLAMNNTEERPLTITDVPITFEMSQDAQNDGIKIFYKKLVSFHKISLVKFLRVQGYFVS